MYTVFTRIRECIQPLATIREYIWAFAIKDAYKH